MADLLAQLLLREELAPVREVEDALKRQVIEGGSLDTLLLEAGAIEEEPLLNALGRAYGLPAAGRDDINTIPPHIPRLFPLPFAETYHLVPYRLEGAQLGVLVNRPADAQLFARIRDRLSLTVEPTVTTEVRLHHAMARLYNTELQPRYRALLAKLDGPTALQTLPSTTSAGVAHVLSWGLATMRSEPTPQTKPESHRPGGVLARLAAASHRDAIVDILLEVMATTFEFAAMFVVHGEQVHGWRGADSNASERIARVSIPVSLPSVFQTIYATNGHYLGPLPANSINTRLIEELGRKPPRAAFLAPILVGGKLAAIVYADNGVRPVSSKRVASLLLVTHRAGMCLEALIRRKKASAKRLIAETNAEANAPVAKPVSDAGIEPSQTAVAIATEPSPIEPPPLVTAPATELTVLEDEDFDLLPEITSVVTPSPTPFASPDSIAPPPLPPRIPTPTVVMEVAVETPASDTWESVQVHTIDTKQDSTAFAVDASPDAATADFEKGLLQIAAQEQTHDELDDMVVGENQAEGAAASYVAFADIDETPEESVGDWEDVLVDTVAAERLTAKPVHPTVAVGAPPAVTWDHVIAEAEAAISLDTVRAPQQLEIAGTSLDERAILLDGLEATNPDVWRNSIEKLRELGTGIDDEIRARFPGTIGVDPFAPDVRLPPFSMTSGITAYIAARGTAAAAWVLPFLESDDRRQRLFAVYYLYAVYYPPAVELLARRLYDAEPKVRVLAADALRVYRHEAAYRRIVQGLRDHLKVPMADAQVATAQVLGQLREPSAVPSLIPLVVSTHPMVSRAAASSLAVVCGQAFGPDVTAWADWWQKNFNKPRDTWLADGMRHMDATVRRIATREYQLLSGRMDATDSGATPEPNRR